MPRFISTRNRFLLPSVPETFKELSDVADYLYNLTTAIKQFYITLKDDTPVVIEEGSGIVLSNAAGTKTVEVTLNDNGDGFIFTEQ